jgi:hypothetical protein
MIFMAITQGTGTQTDPYILTSWKDLYEIENRPLNSYYKFKEGVSENLDNLYPDGKVPEVILGDYSNRYINEIDFNGATFTNGRFDGFSLTCYSASTHVNIEDARTFIKNLNLINVGDTGAKNGIFHYKYMTDTLEYLCPITIDGCRLVIEGLSSSSGLLQRGMITRYTGYSIIKRCNITLKGTEIFGASWDISDSIIFFDDVLLNKSCDIYTYDHNDQYSDSSTAKTYATMCPVIKNQDSWTGGNVLSPALADCTVYGKVRTSLGIPTALIFSPSDRVIFDIECDNLLFYRSTTAVAYNVDKTAKPYISIDRGDKIIQDGDFSLKNLYPLTSDEIKDANKLYEIGFPVKKSTEGV